MSIIFLCSFSENKTLLLRSSVKSLESILYNCIIKVSNEHSSFLNEECLLSLTYEVLVPLPLLRDFSNIVMLSTPSKESFGRQIYCPDNPVLMLILRTLEFLYLAMFLNKMFFSFPSSTSSRPTDIDGIGLASGRFIEPPTF